MPDLKSLTAGGVTYDVKDDTKLPLSGGTMAGDIDADGHKITGLPTPTVSSEAANKAYLDDAMYSDTVFTDALNISLTDPLSDLNRKQYKLDTSSGTTNNMPPGCTKAIRRPVNTFDANNIVVELIEVEPVFGRRWFNKYNGSTWIGWTQIISDINANVSFTQGIWSGQLGHDSIALSFPAHLFYRKYSNGVLDLHIDTKCEDKTVSDNRTNIWSYNAIKDAMGVNSFSFNPKQTRVSLYNKVGDVNIDAFGRTGLQLLKTSDGAALLLGRIYNDAMHSGGWASETYNLYAAGTYYHIDIYGAAYT